MDNITFANIIREYDVEDIEKHLVFHLLDHNHLSYEDNEFLSTYMLDWTPNNRLLYLLRQLGHNSIETIAVDMELLIPVEDKKVNGAFFTPSYIVDYIIESIAPSYDARIIDFSCGSGAFLLGIVRYYKKAFNKSLASCIKENVFGADILEYNIRRSKLLLSLLALFNNEIISAGEMNLLHVDSLKHKWNNQYDAVIGNPPYVKFQDMDDETREFLLSHYDTTKFGTYNLYFAFFELGLKLLKKDGKLGYITPNNYFTSLAGECLRTFFQKTHCVYRIVDFNATKVFDVQTYTAITFINRNENESIEYGRIANGDTPQSFLSKVELSSNPYDCLNVKKWRLLCGSERENIYAIENSGDPIGLLFNICVGIATLKDEVYFISPVNEDDSYFYMFRNGVTFKIEKTITRPLVKISDAKEQKDIDNNKKVIIFPYKVVKSKATAIPEEELKKDYPYCYKYLLYVKPVLEGRDKGKHTYKPFYAYGRTQGLNRNGIKLLTPTFSKVPRFLLDKNTDGFFTNGYGIYTKKDNSALFGNLLSLPENFDIIQKILNSFIMEYYVDKTSVAIEGGYPCYQKNFIERFTIPNFSYQDIDDLRSLSYKEDIDKFLIKKYQINLPLPKRCS